MPLTKTFLVALTFAAASFTVQGDRTPVPKPQNKCCTAASEAPPSWKECRDKCEQGGCVTGSQLGAVLGGTCATQEDKTCGTTGNHTTPVHMYKCQARQTRCPDGKFGIVCVVVKAGDDVTNVSIDCEPGQSGSQACDGPND